MAALSLALSKSLDRLRKAILEAEEEIAKQPGSNGVCMPCGYLDEGELRGAIFVVSEGKQAKIMCGYFDQDEAKHILDLPVAERIKVADYIPELIGKTYLQQDELAKEAEDVIARIQIALV